MAEKRFLDLDVIRSPKKIKPTSGNINNNNSKNIGLSVLSKLQNKELDNQESSEDKDESNNEESSSYENDATSNDLNSDNNSNKEKKLRNTNIHSDSDSEEDSSGSEDNDTDVDSDSEVNTKLYEPESTDTESVDVEVKYSPKDKINNKLKDAENNRAQFDSYVSPSKDLPAPQKFRSSKAETQCRRILEVIFNKPFPQVRPSFLNNPETNCNLEIDCYNAELKLGVEYNSEYHYKWPNFTGQTKEEFIKVLRRDDYKRRACDEEGVYLIIVPYTVPFSKLEDYIREQIEIWRNS